MKNKPTSELRIYRNLKGYWLEQKWTDGSWHPIPVVYSPEVEDNVKEDYDWRGGYTFPS